ncbi:Amino acid transporter, transmembrane domain [Cinara cedri]|uniref:Amino acid transporter, transmembrane domain n=1 Tax=Cinara cedri TaxID=506608 RepID=A0A5E4N1T4_9HEMI|nr:Amino acid transporter, transmembrane domain [Cinara cedri]
MEERTRRTHARSAKPADAVDRAASQPLLILNNTNRATDRESAFAIEERHKITKGESVVHLVKATFGGGFLAMPYAFRHAGLIVGSLGTLLIGMAVLNMMSSIVRISQAMRSGKNNGNGDDADIDNRQGNRKLILPPMDYPETVAAVFRRGAGGRFARWAPFAKPFPPVFRRLRITFLSVDIIYKIYIALPFILFYNPVPFPRDWGGQPTQAI